MTGAEPVLPRPFPNPLQASTIDHVRPPSSSKAVPIAAAVMAAKIVTSLPRLHDHLGDSRSVVLAVVTWGTVAAFLVIGLVLFRTAVPAANAWACLLVAGATIPGELTNPVYAGWWLTPIGYVLEQLYLPAAVALTLRYPQARLSRADRRGVILIAVAAAGLRLPQVFTAGHTRDGFSPPPGWPVLVRSDLVHDWLLFRGSLVLTTAGLVWASSRLVRTVLTSRGVARQSHVPVTVVGLFAAGAAAVTQLTWLRSDWSTLSWAPAMVRDLSALAIPVALMGDLLRRRAAFAAVGDLVVAAAQSGDRVALRDALSEALADPSVEVWFAAASAQWRDVHGRPAPMPDPEPGRRLELATDRAGEPLCAVAVDPRVVVDEALIQSALRAVRLGMENDRLRGQLLAQMAELESSRERIVEAGAAERRRVERDLHDGAQQQLLAVAASLSVAGLTQDPAQVRDAVTGARAQLMEALAELRRLARGIHPAALSQGGLSAALPGLGETTQVPTRVSLAPAVRDRRFRPAVEATVYYVVAEALTNVVRHAEAAQAEVTVDLCDGPRLVVTVQDDGRGGAVLRPDGGLAGLRDRIQALGGTLDVAPGPHDRGTAIRAEVPSGGPVP